MAMKRNVLSWVAALTVGGMFTLQSPAGGVGDLVVPGDHPHKFRAEIGYDNVQRDVKITSERPELKSKLDADAFFLRLQTDLGHFARLDFDVGALSAAGGDYRFMAGAGLRYQAFDTDNWRGGAFAQVRYTPGTTDRVDLPARDIVDAKVDYDLIEGDAGFLVGYKLKLTDDFTVMPYAGPILSIVRLSSGDFKDPATGDKGSFRGKEDHIVGGAAGVSLLFPGQNGIRFETRYVDDVSVTVAASMVF